MAGIGGDGYLTRSMKVAYHGAPFAGFARQPGLLTVQGSLEEALTTVFRQPVETVCAGRTDAGVHGRGQVVSFSVDEGMMRDRTERSLQRSLNALTHDAVSVSDLRLRPEGFSARFSAVEREYRYFIALGEVPPLFMADFSWHIARPLDIDAMDRAAGFLLGEHDFRSFCLTASAEGKPTCRNVREIGIEVQEVLGEPMLVIIVKGNAFLHSMVRTIVGTLVLVGKGLRPPEWVGEVLEARDRRAAGENAPARGLVFWAVDYGESSQCYNGRMENR